MEEIKARNFLQEIIDADLESGRESKVVTRFPPEPNGYLHIGHAKSICINFGLAEQYGGVCHLRYDDTNPAKEDEEYVRAIEKDINWLGFNWDKKFFASDYFEFMYDCAVTLIKKGLAFVCDMSAEQIRESRGTLVEAGTCSPYRDRSVEENLELFSQMRAGKFAEGECVLRAKVDMSSPNMNMRDPVIFRISYTAHHRTGTDWVIFPMYDFAHPLEDVYEGVTHSICTLEFEDHRPIYDWVIANCDTPCTPRQYEFARLNLTQTIMSKRYLKQLVENGNVEGWDDPRMPTISGLRRRGYTPESIRDFCDRIGVAKANSEVDRKLLEHCVREHLGSVAPRVMTVLRPLKLIIENYPEGEKETLVAQDIPGEEKTHDMCFGRELYIEQDDFMEVAPNKKYFRLSIGKEVRLKNAYIICATRVDKDEDGNITTVYATYDPLSKSGGENAGRKVKGTLHWVCAECAKRITVRMYDYLLLPDDGEKKDFSERLNPDSLEVLQGFAEPYITTFEPGQRFQFMRQGYFCLDEKQSTPDNLVANRIVDLKDSFKKAVKPQ